MPAPAAGNRGNMTLILTNARLITEDGVTPGTLTTEDGVIRDVQPGPSSLPGAVDLEGDFLAPGLIECHTDNLERHFVPRPMVIWPNPLAATLAHDAQMAAAGVTTVYDAVCVGGFDDEKDYRRKIMGDVISTVERGVAENLFRIDHRLHLRCELTDPLLMNAVEAYATRPLVALASLMDHTPGQRQWRNLDHYRTFISGEGRSAAEIDAILDGLIDSGSRTAPDNWDKAVAVFRDLGIPLASHDDTTQEHVAQAAEAGVTISEFPTTVEAARAAHAAGMKTIGGAPNVVRGGSHSGGVSAEELARGGLLDALSSDYVPASLLQAVLRLAQDEATSLPEAMAFVTSRPADMLGLDDRGRLATGLRADLVRFRVVDGTPLVREVFHGGRRVL